MDAIKKKNNKYMTQLEKDQKLADLQTKQQMLEDEMQVTAKNIRALEATPVTVHKVWEPEYGETYHDACVLINSVYQPLIGHDLTIAIGLAHPTKEAAERHHSFLVMLHDLHKFAVEHNEGWKPDWDNGNQDKFQIALATDGLGTEIWFNRAFNILPYFKTNLLAQKAIDTFGDRLKILFEYYNS